MMYFIRFFISFLTAYFLGRIIYLNFCRPEDKHNNISRYHSFLLGLGFTSIFFWLYTIAANGCNSNYHVVEIFLVAVIYIFYGLKKRKRNSFLPKNNNFENPIKSDNKRQLINYIIIILFCFIAVFCWFRCLRYPDGTWDAMAMWNFRAKFLSLGNEAWNRMYFETLDYSHRDYPLFLPCIIARAYIYSGKEDSNIPLFFSWFFTFSIFILSYLYLKKLKQMNF